MKILFKDFSFMKKKMLNKKIDFNWYDLVEKYAQNREWAIMFLL